MDIGPEGAESRAERAGASHYYETSREEGLQRSPRERGKSVKGYLAGRSQEVP